MSQCDIYPPPLMYTIGSTGTAQSVESGWQRQQVGGAASPLPERASRDPAAQQLPPDILDALRLELLLLVAATAVQEADALIDATQAAGAVLPAIGMFI